MSEDKVKQIMSEDYFYEYGLDPSLKKLTAIMSSNMTKEGIPVVNTAVRRKSRLWMFRDMDDFLYNTLKIDNTFKAFGAQLSSAILLSMGLGTFNNFYCVGQYGIRNYK